MSSKSGTSQLTLGLIAGAAALAVLLRKSRKQKPSEEETPEFLRAVASEARRAVAHRKATLAHVGPESFSRAEHDTLEPDDWRHTDKRDDITAAELQLAKRCHGAHIETLSQDVTQVGSHYLLIHYDVPYLSPETHRVRVHGMVDRELELSMADIRGRPTQTHPVLMACAGTGRMAVKSRFWTHVPWGPDAFGCAKWTGCSLAELLREAGVQDGAAQVIFTGADKGVEAGKVQHFQRSRSVGDALCGHCLICWQMNGQDLVPAHGAPVRLIVPGWYGMASVKWLTSIEVVKGGWWGHQMEAYSYRRAADDPNMVPLQQLPPRALMAPPGCPEFFSRSRVVAPGAHVVKGRAWAGAVKIKSVEFSSDDGKTWIPAELEAKNGSFGWAKWQVAWQAPASGTFVLSCRAVDVEGRSQDPDSDEQFNWTGMGCTQPQKVYVRVEPGIATDGSAIDFEKEQKAAKASQHGTSGLDPSLVEALYRNPGSQ